MAAINRVFALDAGEPTLLTMRAHREDDPIAAPEPGGKMRDLHL